MKQMREKLKELICEAKDLYPMIPLVNGCKPSFEEFFADHLLANDVIVPRDEEEMHGLSYYYLLDQAIESSKRFMAEHDAALAKKIFEEIESVLFTVVRPCPSADGTIIAKHSKDFHLRREDYYTIKEKYIPN